MAKARAKEADQQISEVWLEYKRVGSDALRNRLIENYLFIVKYTAERLHNKLPDEVDVDDLISAGFFGLLGAIDSFDLDRGVKFETYCAPRIRGAILDELRSMDWVPRLVRARSAKVETARKSLEAQLGRKPTDEELREKIGVSEEEYNKIRKDVGAVSMVSMHRKCYETDSNRDVREVDVLEDRRQVNPSSMVAKRDLKKLVTKGLSSSERLILVLYYYEEMTMKEIGQTLDLSESRVSQMHSSIIQRLKSRMAENEEVLEDVEQ